MLASLLSDNFKFVRPASYKALLRSAQSSLYIAKSLHPRLITTIELLHLCLQPTPSPSREHDLSSCQKISGHTNHTQNRTKAGYSTCICCIHIYVNFYAAKIMLLSKKFNVQHIGLEYKIYLNFEFELKVFSRLMVRVS